MLHRSRESSASIDLSTSQCSAKNLRSDESSTVGPDGEISLEPYVV